jgi:flagellar assembly factor FliW
MQFETTRFGVIEVADDKIVTFPDGLPGFEHVRSMALIPHPSATSSPFCWLQCIDSNWAGASALAFPVISPWVIDSEYAPTLPGSSLVDLNISDIRTQAQFWAIVTIPPTDPGSATVNLLAPILLNAEVRIGRQILLRNERYSLKTPLSKQESQPKTETSTRLTMTVERKRVGIAA